MANTSLHTNGSTPLVIVNPASAPVPGVVTYDTLTQRTSYDLRAFLRFEPKAFLFVAIGMEKSWGGEQVAANGKFTATGLPLVRPLADLSLTRDDFLHPSQPLQCFCR